MLDKHEITDIESIHGPILVLGASGFVGANLFMTLLKVRGDVYGTAAHLPAWRLDEITDKQKILVSDLLVESNLNSTLQKAQPLTVFNCMAYGAYSFEKDVPLIYRTNFLAIVSLLNKLSSRQIRCLVHAGTSSEYGGISSAPREVSPFEPNSHYSVSKGAVSGLIHYMGKKERFPCINLRFYSIFGPYEDSSRLIPTIIDNGLMGKLPQFVSPDVSRDFIYVEDACRAFIQAAVNMNEKIYGESFNIGSGKCTTIGEIAEISRNIFDISTEPQFLMENRAWDLSNWYADPSKAKETFGWEAKIGFEEGLNATVEWFKGIKDRQAYLHSSKKYGLDYKNSISAIIACYKDGPAIPIMYERLIKVFKKLNIDYEIIFVNDGSPDESETLILKITEKDRNVIGVNHSRNFGSQASFRSGMELSSKNACVLLDGDLQDPPELIEEFFKKWKEGYHLVYGRRVKREASFHMQLAYKFFYRCLEFFSYIKIPRDAGDFSLIDRKVIKSMLRFPERDIFLRGIRAYSGYKQTGVDYVRPERMFGVSTNNIFKNIGWAKKGILSFTNVPLNMLSTAGVILFIFTSIMILFQIIAKLFFPDIAARGVTTIVLLIIFFGSTNLLALSLVGEYIAKIFEEVKRRPHFIRQSIIRDGEIRNVGEDDFGK